MTMDISIVVPVYNSEKIIPELVSRIKKTFSQVALNYELILVDDCSPDASWKVIEEIGPAHEKIKAFRLSKNCGQWRATLVGMNRAKGKFIVTIDDDLEYAPEDILKLYETIIHNDYQIVFGMAKRKYALQGKNGQLAKWRNRLLNLIWDKPPTDSFRIMKRDLIFDGERFLPEVPVEVFLNKKVDENLWGYCSVDFSKRYAGVSNHSFFKKIKLFLLFTIYYTANPIKLHLRTKVSDLRIEEL